MKRLLEIACFLLVPASIIAQSAFPSKPLVLTHVSIVNVRNGNIARDMSVVIENSHIQEITKSGGQKWPRDSQVVDGEGRFLIPGLWDMHVHTAFGDWLPGGPEVSLPLFIANGVTGVRDMGGDLVQLKQWRSLIESGELIGPRMVVSGPMIDGAPPRFPASVPVGTPEQARRAVIDLKSQGADFIKVQSLIPHDAYLAVADESRKQNITFVGHVPDAVRALEAIAAGQKSVEHFTGIFEGCSSQEQQMLTGPKGPRRVLESYDERKATALISALAKAHVWQVPTLIWEQGQWLIDDVDLSKSPGAKYAPAGWRQKTWKMFAEAILKELDTDPVTYRRQFVEKERAMTRRMYAAGVPFMAGTDTAAGVYVMPGFSLHQELELFVKSGLTPLQALQTATFNPAIFLGRSQDLGTVEKGKFADLVLLTANPLQDIRNTQNIEAVVANGRYFGRKDLDQILEDVLEYAEAH